MPRSILPLIASCPLVISGLMITPANSSEQEPAASGHFNAATTQTHDRDRAGAGRPRFGVSVQPRPGQTYAAARRAAEDRYGRIRALRYFDPNSPNSWDRIRASTGRRPLVVSFKLDPAEVIAGTHDRYVRKWFAHAPARRPTWWSFNPEPEDRIENGEYTARQFRTAWRRLSGLAKRAHNPRLRSALALMCWTADDASGRSWRDYYPGRRHVDVLAWDCYNWDSDRYTAPRTLFGKVVRLARRVDKPWAVAEVGSALTHGDHGRQRADWLRRVRRYTTRKQAVFVTYFDALGPQQDNRLLDRPSRRTWRRTINPR